METKVDSAETSEEKGEQKDKEGFIDPITRAEKAADRLEAVMKKNSEILQQMQEVEVRRTLGGKTEGAPQETNKEINPQEYSQKALEGKI